MTISKQVLKNNTITSTQVKITDFSKETKKMEKLYKGNSYWKHEPGVSEYRALRSVT